MNSSLESQVELTEIFRGQSKMTDSKGNAIDLTNENEPNDELKSEVELDNPESFEEDQDGESYQKLYDLAKQETELLGLFLQLMS